MTDTSAPSRVPRYAMRSLAAAGLCIASLFLGPLGWLAAIVGIVLLRRATLPAKTKWTLAAIALVPKILFLGLSATTAPQGLSFEIESVTLTTSSSLWAWSVLLAGLRGVPADIVAIGAARARRAPATGDAAAAPAVGAGPGGDRWGRGPAPWPGRRIPSHRRCRGWTMGAPARRPRHGGDVHAIRCGVDRGDRESPITRADDLHGPCRAGRRSDLLGDDAGIFGARGTADIRHDGGPQAGHSAHRPGTAEAPGRTARPDSR